MVKTQSEFWRITCSNTELTTLDLGGASSVALAVDTGSGAGVRITNQPNLDTTQYFVLPVPDPNSPYTPLVVKCSDKRLHVRGDGGVAYLYVWVIR